jgi:hypothetical protein
MFDSGMAALTLKKVPDWLLDQLKDDAARERRSVNQHALWLLERALETRAPLPSLGERVAVFRERHWQELSDALDVPRDRSPGRAIEP